MEELVNLIANDAAAAEISDGIKDVLFAKAASKIDAQKSSIALSMFDTNVEAEPEPEPAEED